MSKGILEQYWEDIPQRVGGIALKVLQTITLDAPGSSLLRRDLFWVNDDAAHRYDRSVGLFLFSTDDKRDTGKDSPQRSLANKEPKNMYGWWDLTGKPTGFDCPPERLTHFVKSRNVEGRPMSDLIVWEEARRQDFSDEEIKKVELHWFEALSSQFQEGHWTCWVSLRLNARTGPSKQTMYSTAYVVGSGAIVPDDKVKLAKILYELLAEETIEVHESEITRQSRAAAISQVLSRTMSHNLGSHSLNAFATEDGMRNQFERLETLIAKKALLPSHIAGVDSVPLDLSDLSKHRRDLLARYNNYLRERMDFLADITTAVPAFETRTHFNDDLLKGFTENHLLTTTIAGSPGFDYCWKVEGGDTLVAIPSDVLGRHAFYVILENIVRNSAKHGAHTRSVDYTITLKSVESSDLVEVTILDNKCRPSKDDGTFCPEHADLTDDERGKLESVEELVGKRNVNIDDTVLKNGRVRDGAWGMLEMKACAAYLRRVALEELDEDKYKTGSTTGLPLLKAVASAKGFGYTFYLRKPQRILFTGGATEKLLGNRSDSELRNVGFLATNFEAIGDKENYLHRLWCHVHAKENEAELAELVNVLLDDPAHFPHQVLVVCNGMEVSVDAICADLKDEWKKAFVKKTVKVVSKEALALLPVEVAGTWDARLYLSILGSWVNAAAKEKKLRYDRLEGSNPILSYLPSARNGAKPIEDRYAHHGRDTAFYSNLKAKGVLQDAIPPDSASDIEPKLIELRKYVSKYFLVPFPSGVLNVMGADAITKDADLALRHADHWLDEIVVIDERIQRSVHESQYALESNSGERVWVKHLMDLGFVWVPPSGTIDLNATAFTKEMWERKLIPWLKERVPVPDYVFIHLGVLEKFKTCLPDKSIPHMLNELRAAMPGMRIIITSGRGKPAELPLTECFMSYSAVTQYITQDTKRCPMLLHELARSARRIQAH